MNTGTNPNHWPYP